MRVKSSPREYSMKNTESGIRRVVEAYEKHLPEFGVEFNDHDYDIEVCHVTSSDNPDVLHSHGLYWTADLNTEGWAHGVNAEIAKLCRIARVITVPSDWVADTFRRDMRVEPVILPHGIDLKSVEYHGKRDERDGYVIWNKNRKMDVCDPQPVSRLALEFPNTNFVTTFANDVRPNMRVTGLVSHADMMGMLERAEIYLATTKETFGIGTLEAIAKGLPVLGFDWGGTRDIVQHGVNGYLATPGDYNDLAEGLRYCQKHWKTLSENSLVIAQRYDWSTVMQKVYASYELAYGMKSNDEPTVDVIIPVYNKEKSVEAAIRSVLSQELQPDNIFVIDDGSTDGSAKVIKQFEGNDKVKYVRYPNSGVAHARNRGLSRSNAKYVCCLDADDRIHPKFLRICVSALENDKSLGIAYTRMQLVMPDGSTRVSTWPSGYNYDEQLKHRNQVPTCCVFRREIYTRTGGYHQRYAPLGAGSEDAEFWTRAGSIGFKGELVSNEPLFIYSYGTGIVSRKHIEGTYQETDWLEWHPWAKNKQHPFVSVATPANKMAHPVRQYDEPDISVIIPVGPGHGEVVTDALDSLEAQGFHKWEAILAWDMLDDGEKPFEKHEAYPYVRMINTGGVGAGKARNLAVKQARGKLLLFLDADDYLVPGALSRMLQAWNYYGEIVYSDYIGIAYVGDVNSLTPKMQQRVIKRQEKSGKTWIRHNAFDFDCQKALQQPDNNPYIWCNVTTLMPKAWFDEIGGFDETMESWEDIDLHWRLVRNGHCYHRVAEPLLVYRFYTGHRRQRGIGQYKEIIEYLRKKYMSIQTKGCNCGKSRPVPRAMRSVVPQATGEAQKFTNKKALINKGGGNKMFEDGNVKLCKYNHTNIGQHRVVGHSTGTDYGYKSGGDVFYVHESDIKVQPSLFLPIEEGKTEVAAVPEPVRQAPAPPSPIMFDGESSDDADDGDDLQLLAGMYPDAEAVLKSNGVRTFDDVVDAGVEGLHQKSGGLLDLARANMILSSAKAKAKKPFDLSEAYRVKESHIEALKEAGALDPDKIVELGQEGLSSIKGIGATTAARVLTFAEEYIRDRE